MEVTNIFKELDLIYRVPKELRMEVCDNVHEGGIKVIPKKNKCKKGKTAVRGRVTNSCEKKRSERQRKKERYTHLTAEFERIA